MEQIRWGILGCGRIAAQFAEGLEHAPGAVLAAVGSRDAATARAFGGRFGAERAYGSYEQLGADPDVDIVYVATPHPMHAPNTELCLEHGKAVLCEKPFTVNSHEAERVVRLARQRGIFVMEAMWTRFFPAMRRLKELVAGGAIGQALLLQADFGFRAEFNEESRLFDPNLAGGALLDVGCYVVSLAHYLFGEPLEVAGTALFGPSGVDELDAISLRFPGGATAALSTAIRVETPYEVLVCGTTGRLRVPPVWWRPSTVVLERNGQEAQPQDFRYPGNGFQYEAIEAMRCLREGRTESEILTLEESLGVMRTMDRLREQWGLRYPFEFAAAQE